jgi:signal transduction histidine kinase
MVEYSEHALKVAYSYAAVGFILMAVGVIMFFFLYQKKLVQQSMKMKSIEEQHHIDLVNAILKSQESERKKIAADLHDNLSATLYAVHLSLAKLHDTFGQPERERYGPSLKSNSEIIEDAINFTRQIARELIPVSINITGISGAVRDYCGRLNNAGVQVEFFESGGAFDLPLDHQLSIYRIIQELINNSLKHSGGKSMRLVFNWDVDSLTVAYSDDGKGFVFPVHDKDFYKGLGLLNIKGRLDLMKAQIIEHETPQTGFSFIFKVKNE